MNKDCVGGAPPLRLSETKVFCNFTLRNAIIQTLTISGLQLADLLGGTVVLEAIFCLAGSRPSDMRGYRAALLPDDTIRRTNPLRLRSIGQSDSRPRQ